MKNKIFLIVFSILIILFPLYSNAQNVTCGFDQKHKEELLKDPEYARNVEYLNQLIANNNETGESRFAVQYTVPVIVHVIHTGEAVGTGPNISDAQINSAISNLTDAYRNTGYMGVDIEVEFCLVTLDKDCGSSTGINRVDGTGTGGAGDLYQTVGITSTNELAVKALSRWPADQYYNIWIVTEIDDNDGGSGTQGYAYFPGANPDRDGAVILYNAFGYDPGGGSGYNLKSYTDENTTAIHELGHAFDLYHTFEGDNGGASCPTGSGDFCADTEEHIRSASNCPTGTLNTCTGSTVGNVIHNFMDYSSETCKDRFTANQKTRVLAGLDPGRKGLTTSVGCGSVPTLPSPSSSPCTPSTAYTTNGFGMGILEFELNQIKYYSYHTVRDITAYGTTTGYIQTCMSSDLMENTMYTVNVETGTSNNEDVKVYIDYNNDGDFTDGGEEVFSSTNAMSHSGNITVPTGTAATEVWVRVISDWFPNTISGPCYEPQYGQVEDYTASLQATTPVELTSFSGKHLNEAVELTWKTATEIDNDFFTLERSSDGRNFEAIATIKGAGTTYENQLYTFIDRTPEVGINYYRLSQTDFDGTKTIHDKIVAVNFKTDSGIEISPNPVINEQFQLVYEASQSGDLEVEIYNIAGALIFKNKYGIDKALNYIDISIPDLAKGVYIIKAKQKNTIHNLRFVKAGG